MIRGFQLTEGGFASMDILVVPVIPMLQCIITMLVMIIGFMTLRTSIKRVLAPMKPVKDFMIGFSLVGIVVLFVLNIILLHDFELCPNGYGQRSDGSYCLDRNTFLDVGERLVLIKPSQPPSIPEKLQLTSQIQAGSLCNDCSKTKLISTCFDRTHSVYDMEEVFVMCLYSNPGVTLLRFVLSLSWNYQYNNMILLLVLIHLF